MLHHFVLYNTLKIIVSERHLVNARHSTRLHMGGFASKYEKYEKDTKTVLIIVSPNTIDVFMRTDFQLVSVL